VRAVIQGIVDELLARHRSAGSVDLNDIAEVIDARAVSYEEVELIIARLEGEGLAVGEALTGHDIGVMRSVILAAHRLRAELQRHPTVDELASDCRIPAPAGRRALARARSAGRTRLVS
jgi:hypothetical protein